MGDGDEVDKTITAGEVEAEMSVTSKLQILPQRIVHHRGHNTGRDPTRAPAAELIAECGKRLARITR